MVAFCGKFKRLPGRMGFSEGNSEGHKAGFFFFFFEGNLKGQQLAGNWKKKGLILELRRGGGDGS